MKISRIILLCGWGLLFFAEGKGETNATSGAPAAEDPQSVALGNACEQGDLDRVTALIDQGVSVDAVEGPYKNTPLIEATCHNHPQIVNYLIGKGAKLDALDFQNGTALNQACFADATNCALALLDAGANPDIPNIWGRYPLMNAAIKGNDTVVKSLLAHHADVNAASAHATAIWWAVQEDKLSTVRLLIDGGADLTLKATSTKPSDSLLGVAARGGDEELVNLLLTHGADINSVSDPGLTPLMEAAEYNRGKIVDLLLHKGAEIDLQDHEGMTALMYAARYGDVTEVMALLHLGAKIDVTNKEGQTALMEAAMGGHRESAQCLLDLNADIDAVDTRHETALTYAGDYGATGLVEVLKAKGAKRTDVHIIPREKPATPLLPAQSWALAVGAIYAQTNSDNFLVLGYGDTSSPEDVQQRLKNKWGVNDKAAFLQCIAGLSTQRHPEKSPSAGANPTPGSAQGKEKNGLAWDLCRCANLINWGYAAKYIDEKEAWDLLMPVARLTQANFNSWQEMSDAFLDARETWAAGRDSRFEACAQLLLDPKDPNSPWNQNPWKTDLGNPSDAKPGP